MTYKILVTGSRDWPMTGEMSLVISRILDLFANFTDEQIELWQGECPYGGVDALAAAHGNRCGWLVEGFPPEPSDGHVELRPKDYARRNRWMVDSGPDLVLAFFLQGAGNRGTAMTYKMSRDAKLRTFRIDA